MASCCFFLAAANLLPPPPPPPPLCFPCIRRDAFDGPLATPTLRGGGGRAADDDAASPDDPGATSVGSSASKFSNSSSFKVPSLAASRAHFEAARLMNRRCAPS